MGYYGGWKPTKTENPNYKCRKCKSDDVDYQKWESSCGGFDDIHYRCKECKAEWWFESSDS